jgi:hypothetical protein
MRGCLTFLIVLFAVALIGGWFALPPLAGAAVTGGLGLAGFSGSNTSVTVTADPPLELATLHADGVRLMSSDATFQQLRMATVDVTLKDVHLLDRTAGAVSGTLTGLRFAPATGPEVQISTAKLSGSGKNITATLTLSLADASAIASSAVRAQIGATPSSATLTAPDRVNVVVSGTAVGGRLHVDAGGGLVFQPSDTSGVFSTAVDLIRPGPGVPIHLRTVTVTASGVTLGATLDPQMFGG